MKRYRSNAVRQAGFSLTEVLVAILLFVVVSAITGTLIVQANQATRRATSAAITQSQLLDVVSRMTREVSVSDPITIAKAKELETLTVRDGNSVRTRFIYDDTSREIRSKTSTAPSPAIAPGFNMESGYKVVASNVALPTTPAGATLLAYVVDSDKTESAPADLSKILRVKINLNADVKDRKKPLTIITSMATRLGAPPGFVPPPEPTALLCPVVTNLADPDGTTASLSWPAQDGATYLIRRGPDWPLGNSNRGGVTQTANTFDDGGLTPGTPYAYEVIPQVPGASSPTCSFVVFPAPIAPHLDGTLWPTGYTATLTWAQVEGATAYILKRDGVTIGPVDGRFDVPADVPPFNTIVTHIDPKLLSPSVTYTYQVIAENAAGTRIGSNVVTLTPLALPPPTPGAPVLDGIDVLQTNTLTWTSVAGTVNYSLYRVGTATAIYVGPLRTSADAGRAWGSTAQYYVTATNATPATGPPSNTFILITDPAAPVLAGLDTSATNTLTWTAPQSATSYRLYHGPVLVYSGSAQTYAHTGRGWGSTNTYTVKAWSGKTGATKPVPAMSGDSNAFILVTDPAAPFLTATVPVNSNTVNVSWTAPLSATSYRLFVNGVLLYGGPLQTFSHTGRTWGSSVNQYTVKAWNGKLNASIPVAATSVPSNAVNCLIGPGPFTVSFSNWREAWYGSGDFAGRITPVWTESAASARYIVTRTVGSVPWGGGTWSSPYSPDYRDDGARSTPVYPTALYTYTVMATSANGLNRVVTTNVQSPPDAPIDATQETVYRTDTQQFYSTFTVDARVGQGSRHWTRYWDKDAPAQAWNNPANSYSITLSPTSLNPHNNVVAPMVTFRDRLPGALNYFLYSRVINFGLEQCQGGYNLMQARPSNAWSVYPTAGSPDSGYYAPWGHTLDQWKAKKLAVVDPWGSPSNPPVTRPACL